MQGGYGYGFPQQGYGGQQGQYDQQQQWAMQQQWAQQQAYMAQMQQQQQGGYAGYGYGQQQAMQQQQQMQQGYGGQQAPEAPQDASLGQKSQKGGRGGKGGDKGGGKDAIRRAMEGDRQASMPSGGGGGGGGKGGKGGFESTGDERTSKQAGGGGKKKESSEMTLEEYQAEKARKSAERKAAQAEAQAEARRQAAARMAAAEAGVPMDEPAQEPPKQAATKREKTPEPEPPKPAPASAAKVAEPAAEEEDDWEAAADAKAEEEPSPPPAPEPVEEPAKEVPEAKVEASAPVEATEEEGEAEEAPELAVGMKVKALADFADYEDSFTATAGSTGVVKEIDLDGGRGALLDGGFGDHWFAQAVWCQLEIEVEEEKKSNLRVPDPRPHLNVVFIGHVDAGKSTTCGNILYLSNCVDERTIEKYQKEAKDKNRESWFLAYIMDTNEEEKAKGKTVEVGRACFETENRRFTILDAPGHKAYVPNMVAGASQADIGVLIISARKGEFETGFERGGQTREHAQLAKTLGVDKLVVAVNKMDDPSVVWAQSRFDEIQSKMTPFLKQQGYKEDQVVFLPISGLTGDNIKEKKNSPSWVNTKTLLDTLDSLEPPERKVDAALRIPMLDGFKDMGQTMAIGKVEQGMVKPGLKCIVMPTGHKCTVLEVRMKADPRSETDEIMAYASCGENVTMRMHGINEDALTKGFVLCPLPDPIPVVTKFKAQMKVLELPEERPVMTKGYKCVIHVHVANEECEIFKLYETVYKKKKELKPDFALKDSVLTCSISLARSIALDTFDRTPQLGRFTLRDESKTIAIGKIIELAKSAH